MGYSRAGKEGILNKVLPPERRSVAEVSRETGVNQQTIRNWINKSKSGILSVGSQESSPQFMTPKEKYQVVLQAASIDNEQLEFFLSFCTKT
jgi:transposase